jgi:hypothetical protein
MAKVNWPPDSIFAARAREWESNGRGRIRRAKKTIRDAKDSQLESTGRVHCRQCIWSVSIGCAGLGTMPSDTGRNHPTRRTTSPRHYRKANAAEAAQTKECVMRGMLKMGKLCAALMVLASSGIVHADDDPLNDPSVQKTLRAMAGVSTWYHPDMFGMTAGMRYYAHHKYQDALKYFEIGALYADKLSQLSLGLMYMNGEGVSKDPITAYAWLDLAAERDYPDFVATRNNLKATLTQQQLAQANEVRAKLAERYADAVAKPRMAVQLRQGQMQMTGSRTGYDSGVSHLNTATTCGPALVVGGREVPQAGCGANDMYAKDRWDPDQYFAARDREWKATVTVGEVETQGKAIEKPSQPAPATPTNDASKNPGIQKP